jgi:pentapeptide repeat protein/ion channel
MVDDPLSGYEEFDAPRFEKEFGRKPRRNQAQLDLLGWCSHARDMSVWNQWRKDDPKDEVWLEGINLRGAHLGGARLSPADLEEARDFFANMKPADVGDERVEGAQAYWASLESEGFTCAHLKGAGLIGAHLEGANLIGAELEGVNLRDAHLEDAYLWVAHLQGAYLWTAQMQGAHLSCAHLEGAIFRRAVVDNYTSFWRCTVDKNTDFSGVGIAICRIPPGLKDTLDYNIRRKRCWEGSRTRKTLNFPMNAFWTISDYGRSTGRIALCFFVLSLFFAGIYYFSERSGMSLVQNLSAAAASVEPDADTGPWLLRYPTVYFSESRGVSFVEHLPAIAASVEPDADTGLWLLRWRTIYFSIVTMTTLGFGDMYANPGSILGHIILTIQVMLGYVLLGALICRFGIYFQSQGPPAPLSRTWKPSKN